MFRLVLLFPSSSSRSSSSPACYSAPGLGSGQRPPGAGSCCHLWIKNTQNVHPRCRTGATSVRARAAVSPSHAQPVLLSDRNAWTSSPAWMGLNWKGECPGNAGKDFPEAQCLSSIFYLSCGNHAVLFWDMCSGDPSASSAGE